MKTGWEPEKLDIGLSCTHYMSYNYVFQLPLKLGNFLSQDWLCRITAVFDRVTSTLSPEGVRLSLVTNFIRTRNPLGNSEFVIFFQSDLNPNAFLDVIGNIIEKLSPKECFST